MRQHGQDARATNKQAAASPLAGTRSFTFRDATADKFWEITISGNEVTVRYGRRGAKGQTNTKTFADPVAAQKHADRLVQEKTKKGYVERSAP